MQKIEYAKGESTAIKKHLDGWKSKKRQKTEKKAATASAKAAAAPEAAAAATGPAAAAPRAGVRDRPFPANCYFHAARFGKAVCSVDGCVRPRTYLRSPRSL